MPNRTMGHLSVWAGSGLLVATLLSMRWGRIVALGVMVGGLWNLASVWCLAQLVRAWLGPHPSRRRAVIWLLIKFPLLYVAIFTAFRCPFISVVGFGIGFTIVLLVIMGWWAFRAPQMSTLHSHGP